MANCLVDPRRHAKGREERLFDPRGTLLCLNQDLQDCDKFSGWEAMGHVLMR